MSSALDAFDAEPDTLRGTGGPADSEAPASQGTRLARLEGKVDLLAKDVREVLADRASTSKKLLVARTLGAAVTGVVVGLAPAHAEKAGKFLDLILSLVGVGG